MKNKLVRIAVCGGISLLVFSNADIHIMAAPVSANSVSANSVSVNSVSTNSIIAGGSALNGAATGKITAVLPSGGVNLTLSKAPSLESLQGNDSNVQIEKVLEFAQNDARKQHFKFIF